MKRRRMAYWFLFAAFIFLASPAAAEAGKSDKTQLPVKVSDMTMSRHMLATKAKVRGKTLHILVNFSHPRAVKVIHDEGLLTLARQAGMRRVEFEDWSGFSKDIIYTDLK